MPPRRSTRPNSSRLFDGSSEAGGPLDAVVGRGMSPGPAKYSSSYGSPPTILPTRQNVARQRYNLASALSHMIETVEQDNENDTREREEREAEERRQLLSDQLLAEEQLQENVRAAEAAEAEARAKAQAEAQAEAELEAERRRAEEQRQRSLEAERQLREESSSVELVKEPLPRSRRATSEATTTQTPPPPPSFAEEDSVFAEARIFTPVVPSRTPGGGFVSRTSNALHSLLNSTLRRNTRQEDSGRETPDVEEIERAYPNLHFIDPAPEGPSIGTTTRVPVATDADAGPVPSTARKAISSRIQTPGPGAAAAGAASRARRGGARTTKASAKAPSMPIQPDQSADELALHATPSRAGSVVSTTSRRAGFGRTSRARPSARAASEPVTPSPGLASKGSKGSKASKAEKTVKTKLRQSQQPPQQPQPQQPPSKMQRAWQYVTAIGEVTKALSMAITVLILSAVVVRVFVITTSSPALYEGYRIDNRLHWYGRDWRSNLRQLVPFALVHPLGALSDDEFARMNGLLLSHANEVAQMRHAQRLQSDALTRIDRVLPAVVHMDLDRRGKPVIAQEFWHALKDLLQADQDVFTLLPNKKSKNNKDVSDLQWTALKHRLEGSGLLPDKTKSQGQDTKSLSVREVEGIAASVAENTLSKLWENWLRRNQDKVRDVLGFTKSSGSQQPVEIDTDEFLNRFTDVQIARLAHQVATSDAAREILVPKQDFLHILQDSFLEHRNEIKREMAELEARVVEVARAAAEASNSGPGSVSHPSTSPPPGMTKREVTQLVDQLVRKTVSDAQLEAMARGTIKANWRNSLIHQVNFFSKNAGAVVGPYFSSPTYVPPVHYRKPSWLSVFSWRRERPGRSGSSGNNDYIDSAAAAAAADTDNRWTGRPAPGMERGSVALEPWDEDGDCWCAAVATDQSGQNTAKLAVKLGVPVIPQHVVIEHISASATLDPGSRPKQVEIWAQITDYALQRALHKWSMRQFDDGLRVAFSDLFDWGFVKIGAFVVADSAAGGVQVFRLSPDLEALQAVTDHIMVRAVSNYGDVDHTCFYRVRLYGEPHFE